MTDDRPGRKGRPIESPGTRYEARPCYPAAGHVAQGYESLAESMEPGTIVAADGSPAADWEAFSNGIESAARAAGRDVRLVDLRIQYPQWNEMLSRTSDSIIEGDPHLARLYGGTVADLVAPCAVEPPPDPTTTVVFGPGAALVANADQVWYCDLAKRHRLGRLTAGPTVLGRPDDQQPDFRRMVFVDWPAVDRHREQLVERLDRFVDLFDPRVPRHVDGETMRASIAGLAHTPFRTVPHFMPGSWGGHWMQQEFEMHQEAENLAWSYELIAPEAGVLFGTADPLSRCRST